MKLADYKEKIDAYFDAVSPLDIISRFEALGYEFEQLPNDYFSVEINEKPKNENNHYFDSIESSVPFEETQLIFGEMTEFVNKISILDFKKEDYISLYEDNYKYAMAA